MTPRRLTLTLALAAMAVLVASAVAGANGGGNPILVDPFGAGCPAQHKTVVEPDTYSAGSTIVAAAQAGLFTDGGACDNGFATSTTNGASWTSGVLPGITVYTTSTNGSTWSAVQRIPTDPNGVNGTQDTLIPGVAVDRTTSESSIKVGVGYYYYPNVNCTFANCQLQIGYVSSTNGGSTWTAQTMLRGPMTMSWLPDTTQGRMVGDYISTSFDPNHLAHPVFAEAYVPTAGGTDCATATPNCNQPLETPTTGLAAAAGANVANDPVVYSGPSPAGNSAFRRSH